MRYILLLLFTSTLLLSVNLIPLYNTVDSKKKSRMVYTLTNSNSYPIAVNFSVLQVVDNNKKKETRIQTDKVSVHPTQLVIKKGESKKVRVRYTGKKLPNIQEVYRVIAQELDINVKDEVRELLTEKLTAKVKMRYSYEGLLFVNRLDALSKLEISSFKELSSNNNKRVIDLSITNNGTASDVLSIKKYNFIVTINKKEYALTPKDMINSKVKRILATQSNTIRLDNVSLPQGTIQSIRLELKKK